MGLEIIGVVILYFIGLLVERIAPKVSELIKKFKKKDKVKN